MNCRIKWYAGPDTNTQKSKTTERQGGGCDWTRGPALRGLRAPGCASLLTSCADAWWALFPPLACSFSLIPPLTLWFVCSSSARQLSPLHVDVRPGLTHTHCPVWVTTSEILTLRLTRRHCQVHSYQLGNIPTATGYQLRQCLKEITSFG